MRFTQPRVGTVVALTSGMQTVLVWMMLVGSLLLAACGGTQDECQQRSDCPSGQYCVDKSYPRQHKVCEDPCHGCPSGQHCKYDGIDGGEYYCVNN